MKQEAAKATRPLDVLTDVALTVCPFAFALVIGFALLATTFKLHFLAGMDILFYRGLLLIGLAEFLTFVLLLLAAPFFRAKPSTAFSAAVLSMSFNLSFFVLFPVTIDRSISVFLLGYMAQKPETSFSTAELSDVFSNTYLVRFHQIDRRVREQLLSGNIEQEGSHYRISAQGRSFIGFARSIAWLFDTDPRFIPSPSAATEVRRAPTQP